MKNILVIGSLNMDMVTNVPITPSIGETTLGHGLTLIPGGKGANQAVAIGKLGGDVSMVGVVGDDKYGKILVKNLSDNGVNTNGIVCCDTVSTGIAFIMVNKGGNNSIVVIPGANNEMTPDMIDESYVSDFDYLVAQMEIPMNCLETAFSLAKKNNLYTILNPAPAAKLSKKLMESVDLLVPNETEFEILTGYKADEEVALQQGIKSLKEHGIKKILLTLGEKGARYFGSNNEDIYVSAYIVDAVDTTAGGDSFIGAIVTSLSKGNSINEALEFAMKVGAITVSSLGAQNSLPDSEKVLSFIGEKRNS